MTEQMTSDLDVDISHGLTSAQVEERRTQGSNAFSPLPTKSGWELFIEAFGDPMLKILLGAAAVSLVLGAFSGHWIDGIAISLAVLVVTSVGTYNQVRANRDYTALDAVSRKTGVKVVRDGRVDEIDSEELVHGDVFEINTGDVLPADATYVRGADLLINEAAITGEPDTTKSVGDKLYSSSRVLDGSGRAVVAEVGDATVFGKARLATGERDKTTPLEERLDALASKIGKAGTFAAVLTFFALIGSGYLRDEAPAVALTSEFAEFILDALIIAVTIIVVAVPEGLPLAVTLSLAYTTRKMAQDNALVRELAACETMGAATIVCSDKTGTLTAGAMTLNSADIGGQTWDAAALASVAGDASKALTFQSLAKSVAVNSTADLVEREGEIVVAGNSTEGALLKWLVAQDFDYRAVRDDAQVVARREFNSTRKHMLTVADNGDGTSQVHMKGAPEVVLSYCSTILSDGDVVPLDKARADAVLEALRQAAGRGNRTLGFAQGSKPAGTENDQLDQGLTFTGVFVIADPIRLEVPDSVDLCRRAGVRVMMITGDIHETAQEIGRQSGIVRDGDIALEGPVFRKMTDEQISADLRRISVLSRALPDDKKRMVELLQAQGDVVAVTGDGVNDAPALVTADVGFSMGSGSKVAREASDIVLVDDNFASLVRAIRWGRSVFENIRKFLQFQLTVNVVALSTAFVAALAGYGTPLTAVQLLWVNLIMDSLAALALALEPPTDELFDQPPHGREEPLISRSMWISVMVIGIYMFAVLIVILTTNIFVDTDDDIYRNTFLFNMFVWMQIWNEFNSRSTRFNRSPFTGLTKSFSFLWVVVAIALLQLIIVTVGGSVFSTVPLSIGDWAKSIGFAASVLVVAALVRLIGRATMHKSGPSTKPAAAPADAVSAA